MQGIIQQLMRIRRTGRLLLFLQVLLRWVTAILVAALACGVLDYILRLPGWLRLVVGVAIAATAIFWLVTRAARAVGFAPDLSVLALRLERLYPQLAGSLTSGVEFTLHRDEYDDPQTTAALTRSSVQGIEKHLGSVSLGKLIDPTHTMRTATAAAMITLILAGIVFAAPDASMIAAKRWLAPLSETQWPRRTDMTSNVDHQVWPTDTPVPMEGVVERGYRPGLRAWVWYRLTGPQGQSTGWQFELMSEQLAEGETQGHRPTTGHYARLLDLSNALAGLSQPEDGARLEFYFAAGDTRTPVQSLRLIPRPAVEEAFVEIQPPAYASQWIDGKRVALHEQVSRVTTVSARVGSKVTLRLTLNKAIPDPGQDWTTLLPGFAGLKEATLASNLASQADGSPDAPAITLTFTLRDTVESALHLTDEHGLENLSDRLYRIEAIEDKPPVVSLTEPATDESVLPTARVTVKGIARDDVALASLHLESDIAQPRGKADAEPADPGDATGEKPEQAPAKLTTLERSEPRQPKADVTHELDLANYELQPGDEVTLFAVALDVFELDGKRHDAVRSLPRRLRIINAAELINQVRNELAGLRQQAIRLDARQRELVDQPAERAAGPQKQLAQNIARQKLLIDALKSRLDRNRLEEPALDRVLDKADDLLKDAQSAARTAGQKLDQANQQPAKAIEMKREAKKDQADVNRSLVDLISLLDQGKDALTLQLQLQELAALQEAVAGDTREMMPRTVGKTPEQLTPQQREALDNLANRQKALAEQADNLTEQMRNAADAIRKQSENQADKATAQALDEAADIAERQGLEQKMQEAAEQSKENQLSKAGESQQQSSQVMQQMLESMNNQEQRRKEMLRRLLTELADAIERLIEQQRAQLQQLTEAKALAGLDPPMITLRRNTMATEEKARASEDTAPVAGHLKDAADYQADAVRGLRDDDRPVAERGETDALAALEEALAKLRELQSQEEQDENRQERNRLKEEYERLAREQLALRDQTREFTDAKDLDRRQRAKIRMLANLEADIRMEAAELGRHDEMAEKPVFLHQHEQIDQQAEKVVVKMRTDQPDEATLERQRRVAATLTMLAEALEQINQDEDFDQASGGGGGGGGQGGGQPPMIPPIAELKLLKGVQERIYDETRSLNEADALAEDTRMRLLLELSAEQRELAGLGEKLIEKLQQQAQQQPRMRPPQPPEENPE